MKNNLSPQQEYFMKSSCDSLNCIDDLCCAVDGNDAVVHEIFTASNWNIKISQDATCELHYMKQM